MTDSTNARRALQKVEKCILKGQRILELHLICSSRNVKKWKNDYLNQNLKYINLIFCGEIRSG